MSFVLVLATIRHIGTGDFVCIEFCFSPTNVILWTLYKLKMPPGHWTSCTQKPPMRSFDVAFDVSWTNYWTNSGVATWLPCSDLIESPGYRAVYRWIPYWKRLLDHHSIHLNWFNFVKCRAFISMNKLCQTFVLYNVGRTVLVIHVLVVLGPLVQILCWSFTTIDIYRFQDLYRPRIIDFFELIVSQNSVRKIESVACITIFAI